jgi:hypothetical protein
MAALMHKPYAGRSPAKEISGVAHLGTFPCAFCDKKFSTIPAAKMHEDAYHKKKINKLRQAVDADKLFS